MQIVQRARPRRLPTVARAAAITVGALGALAIVNALLARQAERRNPPNGRFVTVDGVRLHYLEQGSGSPVVLLHGNQSMAEELAISGVVDLIARQHRVIAFDRPGFGHSERPRGCAWTASEQAALIRKALHQLGVETPIMVGHSWGALAAATYAIEHPADVAAVLVLAGYYFPTRRLDAVLATPMALPVIGDVLRYAIAPLIGWLTAPLVLKQIFAPSQVPARFWKRFPASLVFRPSQIGATAGDAATMRSGAAHVARRYQELAVPITIMAGRGDRIVDVGRHPERLHAVLPHSTLELLEGTGHMLHHAFPERVAAAIEALSAQVQAKQSTLVKGDQHQISSPPVAAV